MVVVIVVVVVTIVVEESAEPAETGGPEQARVITGSNVSKDVIAIPIATFLIISLTPLPLKSHTILELGTL